MDLPYKAEYAKSGRSSCRGCKSSIPQASLRLAVMVQSPMFDGKTPQWYHLKCFFNKQRPKTVDDIENYETLRIEDQEQITEKVRDASQTIVPTKKGKKRGAGESSAQNAALKDFKIEYSKSSRAMCRGCEQKIMKDEIRISKKDFESEVGRKYGGQDMWHHVTCFAKLRSELGYFECGDKLPGFKSLNKADQKEVTTNVPAIKQEDIPDIKKPKTEDEIQKDDKEEKKFKDQITLMYKYKDQLKDLKKNELAELLHYNNQDIPSGEQNILDRLSDVMTFGALKRCKVCGGGQLVFSKLGYLCHGNLTEWTKCEALTKEPERVPFKIPSEFKEIPFLKKYKFVARTRIIKNVNPTNAVKKEESEVDGKPKVERAAPALYNMEFVLLGVPPKRKDALKKQIVTLGGKVVTKIKNTVMAVISTEAEVEKMGARMKEAESEQVHVVSEDFLDLAKDNVGKIPELVIKKSICNWGSDPSSRLPPEPSTSNKSAKSRSIYTKSVPSKVKLTLKGGSAVDPDSGLDDIAHVYQEGNVKFTVVLGETNIQKQKNSYYKLQLLQNDHGNRFWVFRSWGRIGTSIGGNKLEVQFDLREAKSHFMGLYEEKSGNCWENRHNFTKIPGRMYPIDIDYGEDESVQKMDIVESKSNLQQPVQDLIKMIFDVNSMKKLMLEFELDTEKMPLGKLSKAQIQSAFGVLGELQQLIETGGQEARFIDASNRFYTFIPHSFGIDNAPILRDSEVIKKKIDMLDNLMELEIAYNLMKSSGSEHTVDSYYKQLKTEVDVLDRKSEEFAIIKEYLKNTHATTHSSYKLEIEDVYTIKREGEVKRYKPFKKLHNKKLLWHGSRRTNYAGILSQGLRIAPPEAPVTGYMFGKGIYFADMVSKSANYCSTNPSDPKGLLLLCEVALGDMYEREQADYIEKLPKGKHSTKGVGRTEPNPESSKIIDGVEVPVGKGQELKKRNTSLLYNEYIVYDVAQVNIKYLLKVNFKYKY